MHGVDRPVYGLIFLFKYVGNGMELGDPPGAGLDDGVGVFFAQQIINNACATQAGLFPSACTLDTVTLEVALKVWAVGGQLRLIGRLLGYCSESLSIRCAGDPEHPAEPPRTPAGL